ncbi:MAG TPA: hypothetical protein VGM24_09845, partial [Puia sp.]
MVQFIKTVARHVIFLMLPALGFAQSTFLPEGSKYDHFLDRLGILLQSNPDLNVFTPKPLSRKVAVGVAEMADSIEQASAADERHRLSNTDLDNLHSLLMNNSEWATGSKAGFESKHPLWNTIYKTKANFLEVNQRDFFLAINPVIQQQQSSESGNNEHVFLNSKGLTMRGLIGNHL